MTYECPEAAQPTASLIREKVRRPPVLPRLRTNWKSVPEANALELGKSLRWDKEVGYACCCPAGLLPGAVVGDPCAAKSAGLPDNMQPAMTAFIDWWDSLTDPKAAVDAVWGTKQ